MFQNHLRLFSREFFGSAASARRSDRESLVLRNPELPYVCCQKLHEPTPLPACGHPLPALRGEGRERGADLVHGFDSCPDFGGVRSPWTLVAADVSRRTCLLSRQRISADSRRRLRGFLVAWLYAFPRFRRGTKAP